MDHTPFVTVRFIHTVIETLSKEGISEDTLLRQTFITQEQLEQDYSFISLDSTRRLFLNAIQVSDLSPEQLCFKIGSRTGVATYGVVGIAAMFSETICEALEVSTEFSQLLLPCYTMTLEQTPLGCCLQITEKCPIPAQVQHAMVYAFIGSFLCILSTLTDKSCAEFSGKLKINLPVPRPTSEMKFPIPETPNFEFNSPAFTIVINQEIIERPIRWANQFAKKQALVECLQLRDKLSNDIVEQVLMELMDSTYQFPTANSFANRLGISSRQLHRILSERGVTYRSLVRDVKFARAKKMLLDGQQSVTVIADMLGYADTSNFSKAFKAEMGISPSDFSKTLRVK